MREAPPQRPTAAEPLTILGVPRPVCHARFTIQGYLGRSINRLSSVARALAPGRSTKTDRRAEPGASAPDTYRPRVHLGTSLSTTDAVVQGQSTIIGTLLQCPACLVLEPTITKGAGRPQTRAGPKLGVLGAHFRRHRDEMGNDGSTYALLHGAAHDI